MMEHALTLDAAAAGAAHHANKVVSECLRYLRDGPLSDAFAFESDVSCELAAALKLVLDIENGSPQVQIFMTAEEVALYADLKAAIDTFLAGVSA
ncbi:hypothetical protein [Novosphingobium naphthalenivorans]|uniref:hypothetical protein n=1 Tax=Novosphingobium naphthalenivorans TaxID=273168 RepID=UPI000832AFAD|nr:hypothetical protein [Novosphingobium naphthalenivorans]